MSQVLLAIQNILQNSNIFNRSREQSFLGPFYLPQNLGGGEVQIWESVGKMSKL